MEQAILIQSNILLLLGLALLSLYRHPCPSVLGVR
jgi:hypothetical protein